MSETTPDRFEGNEGKNFAKQHLVKLKVDVVNWQTLLKNQKTGEFWKEYFPWPEAHGGGPSVFVKITDEDAKRDFGSW
jgi:hypothetical protein